MAEREIQDTTASVFDSLSLYGHLLAVSLRGQMQYVASFWLSSIGQFVTSGVEILGVWALFERFGHLAEWTLPQVALFYGVVNVSFALCDAFSRGFDIFGTDYVKTGNFDRVLLRPRSTVLQLAGHELTLYRIGRLAQGALVLGGAIYLLSPDWGPGHVALLAFAILGGMALFYGLMVIQATMAFWTIESLEIMNTLTYGGVETAQYPLAIYHRYFRRFFTVIVPLGCVSYFPIVALLGIDDPLGTSRLFQYAAPTAGFLFLGAALFFWRFGVRHYTSTGS